MFQRAVLLMVFSCLLMLPSAAQTNDAAWTAWLYDPTSGDVWLLADDGSVLRQQSGFASSGAYIERFPRYGSEVISFPTLTVSTTGRYFAYGREDALRVLDTTTSEEILNYHLPGNMNSFHYSWVRRLFNEDDTLLAFGINRSDYQTMEGGWEIIVLDLSTGKVVHTLRDTDAAARDFDLPGFNFVPLIQQFDETGVTFFLFPDGMESGPAYAAWTWNIETGEITANRAYLTHSTDYFAPTSEVIFPIAHRSLEQYPCEGECGQFIHVNTLYVYDPTLGVSYPFYHSPTIHFWQAHFIQNAEKIVTQGFSYEAPSEWVWHMLERDGELVADISALNIASLAGIPEGFIFTQDDSPDLMSIDTRSGIGEPAVLWTNPDGRTPIILWASEPHIETTYTPWARLIPLP